MKTLKILVILILSGCGPAPLEEPSAPVNEPARKIVDRNQNSGDSQRENVPEEHLASAPIDINGHPQTGDEIVVCVRAANAYICPIADLDSLDDIFWTAQSPEGVRGYEDGNFTIYSLKPDLSHMRNRLEPMQRFFAYESLSYLPLSCSLGSCSIGQPAISEALSVDSEYLREHKFKALSLTVNGRSLAPTTELVNDRELDVKIEFELTGLPGRISYSFTVGKRVEASVKLKPEVRSE